MQLHSILAGHAKNAYRLAIGNIGNRSTGRPENWAILAVEN